MTIEESLNNFGKVITKGSIITTATIVSIDETKYTCTIKTPVNTYYSVPLKVKISEKASVIEIPKVGTYVLICCRERDFTQPQILMIHEVEKYNIKIGNSKIDITDEGIIFNEGTVGVPLTEKLITQLNNLENKVNAIIAAYNAHNHLIPTYAAPPAAPAPTPPTTSVVSGTLTPTKNEDIANEKIKQ